jgi:hypothetical protein
MRSIGFMPHGRTKNKTRTVVRSVEEGGVDASKKAKQTKDELESIIAESDNRQDVNIVSPTYYQTRCVIQNPLPGRISGTAQDLR